MKSKLFAVLICSLLLQGAQGGQAVETATFAGGCFWCMEEPFEKLDGVESVTSGFCGGGNQAATYKDVSAGGTAHMESIQIKYDPAKISYEKLLEVFWRNIDPTDAEGQFCDRGSQYRSAIFYHNEQQKALAEESLSVAGAKITKKIATPILPAGKFFPAEEYHQDYYKKNPAKYKQYKIRCQRERKLHDIW